MHKILITGNAGCGKTTLSFRLAKIFNRTDVISLDKLFGNLGGNWLVKMKENLK